MNCQKFKLDILDYLDNGNKMPKAFKSHMSECKECRNYHQECYNALQNFLKDDEVFLIDVASVDIYTKSIIPSLNRKSNWLQEQKQKRRENIVFGFMIFGFLGLIIYLLYSYICEYNPWPTYVAILYAVIASILVVLIIPNTKTKT